MTTAARQEAQSHIIEAQQHIRQAAHLMRGSRVYDVLRSHLDDLAASESLLIPDDRTKRQTAEAVA